MVLFVDSRALNEFIFHLEDLNDWLNEQMKELEQIYEEKLADLKRAHMEMKDNIRHFQDIQRKKIVDIRRLFNSKLNKQISLEQLQRMKTTVGQFRDDIEQFQSSITSTNDQEKNPFSKATLDNPIGQSPRFQLNVDAKPFEYNLIQSIIR